MRKFIFSAGVVLFVLAASCLYVGVSELSDIRPASDYEDKEMCIRDRLDYEQSHFARTHKKYNQQDNRLVCSRKQFHHLSLIHISPTPKATGKNPARISG